jgi:hypothetical protein
MNEQLTESQCWPEAGSGFRWLLTLLLIELIRREIMKFAFEGSMTEEEMAREADAYAKATIEEVERHVSSNGFERPTILTMQEWLDLELSEKEGEVEIGTSTTPIVRPKTKNLIEAPEKSFKTTVLLRLLAGLSCGKTVYPDMPVVRPRKVLYLHGELSDAEIKDRTIGASAELPGPNSNFLQGRVREAHLIDPMGQKLLDEIVKEYGPEDLVLDPWQSSIEGFDENSFKDMSKATGFCNKLIEEHGVTLWIPIHLGKVHKKGARGHSTVQGWRDTRIRLIRDEDCVEVTVEPRFAPPLKPFGLKFRDGTMWMNDRFSAFGGLSAKIRAFVEGKGGSVHRKELAEYLGSSPDAVRKAIRRAAEDAAIVIEGEYLHLAKEVPITQ